MQEDRVRFLHAILDFAAETESADISFTKNKMMQKLKFSDGEFYKIQKSLGQNIATLWNIKTKNLYIASYCQVLVSS
jgi:queuine/archaeosine tRNA-ribosyltransferase